MRYERIVGRCCSGGNLHLRYKIEYPIFEECERASERYRELAGRAEAFCLGELSRLAEREGGEWRYRLFFAVAHCSAAVCSTVAVAELRGAGGERYTRILAINHDPTDGALIPEDMAMRRGGVPRRARRGCSILLDREPLSLDAEGLAKRLEKRLKRAKND